MGGVLFAQHGPCDQIVKARFDNLPAVKEDQPRLLIDGWQNIAAARRRHSVRVNA
jgi:hypothetical protein